MPREFHWRSLPNTKEELMPSLYSLFQKIKEGGTFPTHLIPWSPNQTNIVSIPPKKNYRQLSFSNVQSKICYKILANWIQQCIKNIIHDQAGSSLILASQLTKEDILVIRKRSHEDIDRIAKGNTLIGNNSNCHFLVAQYPSPCFNT